MNEFVEAEVLDAHDPLRHLMHAEDDEQHPDDSRPSKAPLLPPQNASILDQTDRLSFSDSESMRSVSVCLRVDASPGCGGIAWPAGRVLSEYIVRHPDLISGREIVELGSGTGLVGLVAAQLGAQRVWITDQQPLLPIMKKNVEMNDLAENVEVEELNWGEPVPPNFPSRPDVILAADCVYYEPAFPLLVQTLADLSDSRTEILFCYKKRRKADKRFFTMLRKKFKYTEIPDKPYSEVYSKEAISLLRLTKIASN